MSRKGYTLIELMVTVAIIGIAGGAMNQIDHLHRLTHKQAVCEGLVRVLENDIEMAVACPDRRCLTNWAKDSTPSAETDSWARAALRRQVSLGPDGTWRVAVSGEIHGLAPSISASRLVWVPR